VRAPRRAAPGAPGAEPTSPGRTNLGLSSSGSRGSGSAASAGVDVPGVEPSAPAQQLSAQDARREIARLTGEGRGYLEKGKYPEAVRSFSAVLDLDPANIEAKEQLDQAASKVLEQKRLEEDLQTAKEFFVEKDYESALRKFYRLPRDRNLGELDLFIRNAWYNWAVVSMKGGNCVDALNRLKEALTVDPGDSEASKLQEVAETYKDKPKDKVFYAYADRITYRTLNQK
jgi:tetratricopeptide (TPR) repeat protein